MENITNGKTRRVCLPKLGSICLWIRKSKKDGAAANASVVPERVEEKEEDRTYEKMTIDEECWIREDVEGKLPHVVQYGSRTASKNGSFREEEAAVKGKDMQNQLITVRNEEKCCMSEDVEGEKLPVDNGSSISNAYGILRGKEVTSNEKPEEVAQMSRDIAEDGGETKTVVGDNKSLVQESNAVKKNSIFRVKEVIAGEGSKETTDENRDEVLAIDKSLCLVEIPKDEKSDELKLIVEQGPESMYSNRTQAEHDLIPPTQDLARPVQPLPKRGTNICHGTF
ncbi:hypothetical protein AALP_AA8G400900 [Arabis alpina]|uniref:Uncharacterized protein n=1 Tax=Arabis alpina TaxID=50452 RepID=A0A087GCG9_ARAAL|nr:hypothetical protein AALP_AA8G400900 [Arabis alpina]